MNTKPSAPMHLFGLANLGVAMVSGEDATEFLQGQLSNDITLLQDNKQHQLSAYCNPKGRILALFHVLKLGANYALIAPEAVLAKVLPRLRLFVMRAAVNIEPLDSPNLIGLQLLPGTTLDALDVITKSTKIVQHSIDTSRYFILHAGAELRPDKEIDEWNLIDIQQQIPQVFIQLHETLIPQSLNLDIIGSVNFKKGCFPGQEIIARVKYRGKPKTRMIGVSTSLHQKIELGAPIYIDERDGSVGQITNIANGEDGTLMSITVPASHINSGKLYINDKKVNQLNRLPSIYEVTV